MTPDATNGRRRASEQSSGRQLTRRSFIGTVGAAALAPTVLRTARAGTAPRVLVVGGGFAGATVAKYLKLWGGDAVSVTLIDKNASHVSCVMSNLVLNGTLRLRNLRFGYTALARDHGVDLLKGTVLGIDAGSASITVAFPGDAGSTRTLEYDRLVLAPGVSFEAIPGWNPWRVPHAWIAGFQTLLLRDQIAAMPDTGTVVVTVPRTPYRCPPGPYERACVVADILGRRSGVIGGAGSYATGAPRVIVLDANDGIQAEKETFTRAFETIYSGIVEYVPNAVVEGVDSINRVVMTSAGDYRGDVVNVIPRHRAPPFVFEAGLTAGERWAPVDPLTYESTVHPGIHVIGDSQGTGQPKSGHMANSEAKVCAEAILRIVAGTPTHDPDRMANVTTNSACYSPITYDEASWLTAGFAYDPGTQSMRLTPDSLGEAGRWNRENYAQMFKWAANLFADTFG